MKKSSLVIIFLFAFSVASVAQVTVPSNQALTLEQCIDYALKNNISVKQTELNTEISKINLTQSQANLLPNLNGNASHSYNYGRTIDRFTNQFATQQVLSQNLSLSSDVTVFSGLQNINNIKENKYTYLAGKYDVEKMKNDISLNIASEYLQILYNTEALTNAKNQMATATAQVARAKVLVESGAQANGTLLDMQSQLAMEELNVTNAQNQLDISYLTLAQLMNMPSAEGLAITKPVLDVTTEVIATATPATIYNTAVTNLPEVKSADYKLKSSDKALSVARGGLSPKLSFSAAYGTGYSGASQRLLGTPAFAGYSPNGDLTSGGDTVYSPGFTAQYEKIPFKDQYSDNVNKSFGFYLTVPIFNRFQVKSSIDRAKIQKLNAELTLESTKLNIQKTIQQAYADANAALKKYMASKKALDAMQESFNYTEQKYNVGMINTTDYNTAKNKLIKTESDVLSAKYEYVFKTKVLDFYQGKPLKL